MYSNLKKDILEDIRSVIGFILLHSKSLIQIPFLIFLLIELLDFGLRELTYKFKLYDLSEIMVLFPKLLYLFPALIITLLIENAYRNRELEFYSFKKIFLQNLKKGFLIYFIYNIIISVGYLLLIIPGIFLNVRLIASPYLVIFEDLKFKEAFTVSYNHTAEFSFRIFWVLLLVTLPILPFEIYNQFYVNSQIVHFLLNIFGSVYSVLFIVIGYMYFLKIKKASGFEPSPST